MTLKQKRGMRNACEPRSSHLGTDRSEDQACAALNLYSLSNQVASRARQKDHGALQVPWQAPSFGGCARHDIVVEVFVLGVGRVLFGHRRTEITARVRCDLSFAGTEARNVSYATLTQDVCNCS